MNCNTTHYRANSSSVPGDPTGTGYFERRDQQSLRSAFTAVVGPIAAPTAPATPPPATPVAAPEPSPTGDAVAIIQIPRINVDDAVVEGVGAGDLRKGPGHYPHTPLPGQPGNAAIAGHRTTYGAPFYDLDRLSPGDPIYVTTKQGRFEYQVTASKVVKPSDVSVVKHTIDNRLTLTTCNPRFSASTRLVVTASLVGQAALAPTVKDNVDPTTGLGADFGDGTTEAGSDTVTTVADPSTTVGPATTSTTVVRPASSGISAGLGGNRAARIAAIVLALGALIVGLTTTKLAAAYPRWRWLLIYPLGVVPFAVLLLSFYVELARTLPANF